MQKLIMPIRIFHRWRDRVGWRARFRARPVKKMPKSTRLIAACFG